MTDIVLTPEQAQAVANAPGPVRVRDGQGNVLGELDRFGLVSGLLAELKRRAAAGPWIPGHRVLAHLRALEEEWQRTGGFDHAYMRDFLDRLRAEDQR